MARFIRNGCAGLLALLVLAACTAPRTTALLEAPGGLPPRIELASVPFFPQEDYYCGPAALAMSLAWSGLDETPDSIAPQVYTPGRRGTLASDMITAARRKGRLAVKIHGLDNLLAEIASGRPVVVFQNLALAWRPQWHFAVAIGYDLAKREIILRSGVAERRVIALDAFERTWARAGGWALVTLPPNELPKTANPPAVLLAAAGLEQAGRNYAAVAAYRTIAARWPGETAAWLGQGNAHFALGRFPAAERAYREALSRNENMAQAWNNLAYALHRQGRRKDAVKAARKARHHATGDKAGYRDTLEEVSNL